MPGGADAQVGFVSETVPGTAVTVTKFLPFISESIKNNIEYVNTETLSARRTVRITKRTTFGVEGSIQTELANTTLATLLRHMFGTIVTTGAGPFVHTASPGDLTSKSMTVQVGRPTSTATVQAFTYAGTKIATWSLSSSVGELAKLELGIKAMTETTATALAVASFDTSWSPFVFTEASLTVAAVSAGTVREFNLSGDNKIEFRHRLGVATSKEPLENGVRDYTGTVTTDFDALTHYNLFVNGTPSALVLTFNNGTQTLQITCNVQFTGETPNVGGNDLLAQTLPFRCISPTSDANAITAVLSNSESSSV